MTTPRDPIVEPALVEGPTRSVHRCRWRRTLLASAAALSLGMQDAAWAVCSDGSTFPAGGFVAGSTPNPFTAGWSPGVLADPVGSLFIPDNSVNEHNDPAQPLTGRGHNWVFDQASSLCKETDTGPGGAAPTAWALPPMTTTDCVLLPIIQQGKAVRIGGVPYQGDVITPTCDPTRLSTANAPNPANTYFNQLGCSISHGAAVTAQSATSWLFVADISGGLFSVRLDNQSAPTPGGEAGKTVGLTDYYSAIREGSQLSNAAISKDGRIAIATSFRRLVQPVFACINPLGDPGDPAKPINPNFTVPPASSVTCMQVGSSNLGQDLTTAFGPDSQPYFGGAPLANGGPATNGAFYSFGAVPGGASQAAWPNCIWQTNGSLSLADAFAHNRQNGCRNATSNAGVTPSVTSQPNSVVSHGTYMYVGTAAGPVLQYKVTLDPITGASNYAFRTYFGGTSVASSSGVIAGAAAGVGVAEDLRSLMVYAAVPTLAESIIIVTKLPLCEDMP